MALFPKVLLDKLDKREQQNALRKLPMVSLEKIDFFSNDYLGFARSEDLFAYTHTHLTQKGWLQNGSTGSRLLSGNHPAAEALELKLSAFFATESALVFNSGYDANVGLLSCVLQKTDVVLYDELCHASIRDGLQLALGQHYKFKHNNYLHLEELLVKHFGKNVYVLSESVFSMDGDSACIETLIRLCKSYGANLIVDEAHSIGVYGSYGQGLITEQGCSTDVFARVVTFGKALGSHGAAVLGSKKLTDYLVNFARSFIYTTAPTPHTLVTTNVALQELEKGCGALAELQENIRFFSDCVVKNGLEEYFILSCSAIQSCVISGNERVKGASERLWEEGFAVKPILHPTVPQGKERLRICVHSYNTPEEILRLVLAIGALLK